MRTRLRTCMPGARELAVCSLLRAQLVRRFSTATHSQSCGGSEGGERGPMMPLLFSIGIQGGFGGSVENNCARFLTTCIYCVCQIVWHRCHELLSDALFRMAGIRLLHQRKATTWNIVCMLPKIWEDEALQSDGIGILQTPIRSAQYISSKMRERVTKEQVLWKQSQQSPACSAHGSCCCKAQTTRANHSMCTMPPSQVSPLLTVRSTILESGKRQTPPPGNSPTTRRSNRGNCHQRCGHFGSSINFAFAPFVRTAGDGTSSVCTRATSLDGSRSSKVLGLHQRSGPNLLRLSKGVHLSSAGVRL